MTHINQSDLPMAAQSQYPPVYAPPVTTATYPSQQSIGYTTTGAYPSSFTQDPALQSTSWDDYCMRAEVWPHIQRDLSRAVMETKIVLLLDDSGSMSTPVIPDNAQRSYSVATNTRWSELMGDTVQVMMICG